MDECQGSQGTRREIQTQNKEQQSRTLGCQALFRINLTEVPTLYSENYKLLFKEIQNLNKWKRYSWIRKQNIIKMAIDLLDLQI